LVATICFGFLICGIAVGADDKGTQAALAKKVQNPIANLATVPFQYNYNLGIGEYDRAGSNLNFQPVVPFPGEKWNVISRTIIPINSVPVDETESISGFGDVNLSLFWTPAEAAALTWGVGPIFYLPIASNPEVLGTGKFSLGPTGVVFYGAGKWTLGAVASNAWSIAGDGDRDNVNFFFGQYFINFNFGKGWAMGTAPIITGDWTAPSGQGWTVPFGLQVSKVTHLGSRPANLLVGYYSNVEHPSGAAESQVRIQVNLLYPQAPK
jgi:hypothetical protein